jgi:hypothetical protein
VVQAGRPPAPGLLQTQTKTLDGTLLDLFTTWYPAMAVNDYDGALSTVAA